MMRANPTLVKWPARAMALQLVGNGAQGRDRTTDTVIFSHVLYQLSYLGLLAGQSTR
jgi:hypothetical protein